MKWSAHNAQMFVLLTFIAALRYTAKITSKIFVPYFCRDSVRWLRQQHIMPRLGPYLHLRLTPKASRDRPLSRRQARNKDREILRSHHSANFDKDPRPQTELLDLLSVCVRNYYYYYY